MKTSLLRILPVGVAMLAGLLVPSGSSYGQSNTKHGLVSNNLRSMDFEMPLLNKQPELVVLIFDSATCTYEYAGSGEMKLIACHYKESSSSSYLVRESNIPQKQTKINLPSAKQITEVLQEEIDIEPEPELKEWMITPSDWNSFKN